MNPWIIAITSIFCFNLVKSIESEGMFTSSTDLERLLSTEAELVRALKNYLHQEEERLVKLKQHIHVYEEIQNRAATDVEKYVGNPINSYLLIKKLTSDWKEVKTLMSSSFNSGDDILANATDTYQQPFRWPSEEDLSGAAIALTRLQETYNIDPTDLAHGKINGQTLGPSLSAHDCFELGRQHYNSGDYDHTILWMKEAQKRLDEEQLKGQETVERTDILEYIAFSYYSLEDMKRALHYTNELLAIKPNHPRAYGNKLYYEQHVVEDTGVHRKGDDGDHESAEAEFTVSERKLIENADSEQAIYKKLCRGEVVKPIANAKDLKCQYNYGFGNPYLKIGPFKEEEAYLSPRIVIFHDVASEADIEMIKARATPRFKRATVQNYKTGELETAAYRISKTAWLKPEEDIRIANIYRRVGSVTKLNMETSEELQISNYGIGGHYEPHFDFARREEKNAFASLGTGNRIATWLFYLSDVDMGGATVFPDLGITLWPRKGSAAFWYNLYQNGEGDVRTRHAACPVLAGTKWVSNFWIHERGQEFTRPCSKSSGD